MKPIVAALFAAATGLTCAGAEEGVSISTNSSAVLNSYGFCYVTVSDSQKKTLDAVSNRLNLVTQTKTQTRTIDQALQYLWKTINIAVIQTLRSCTEYKGFFWFSRLDTAGKDDGSFLSGFAVKKGTGEIYRWEEEASQPPPAN